MYYLKRTSTWLLTMPPTAFCSDEPGVLETVLSLNLVEKAMCEFTPASSEEVCLAILRAIANLLPHGM